jgi:Cu/Ag efflux protein CusF
MKTTPMFLRSCLSAVVLVLTSIAPVAHAQSMSEMATGEVRKVDKSASKITIKHGEIKSLDMPPMTMVFAVKDSTLLDRVKAGDKVKFGVAMQDGKIVVTEVQPLP